MVQRYYICISLHHYFVLPVWKCRFNCVKLHHETLKLEKNSQFAKTALLLLHNLEHDGEACHVEDTLHGGLYVDDFKRATCGGDGFVGCKE